ncbi:unnamed protein product, partial [Meganyctiphanes norvegica]
MGPDIKQENRMAAHEEWNPRSLSRFSTFGGGLVDHLPLVNGSDGEVPDGFAHGVALEPSADDHARLHNVPNGFPDHHTEIEGHLPKSSLSTATAGGYKTVVGIGPRPVGTPVAPPVIRHTHSKSLVGDEIEPPVPAPRHAHSRSLIEDRDSLPPISPDGVFLFELALFLSPTDRRFGFSVVGGVDDKRNPTISEITPGSPADKADLEVGDEILEVNGKSLEEATHTEVISHIHQCIRSRTICLRVKRRTGNKLGK